MTHDELSRREFLQTTGGTAAGALAGSLLAAHSGAGRATAETAATARNNEIVRDIAQVVAKTPTQRQGEKLRAIETEPLAARLALGTVGDESMAAGPSHGRFGALDVSLLNGR